ncbi:deoxynucleotidyltransferase terminal-interacting protein 2 [Sitophilus oryzae]|uniref:Deoxynucleotidyltransferase terminal-interacting protein 2 n=1 Tax=Sitophilus oryzae TaxID=7048 RepID=A0A6J2XNQ2_SITOR|nr:deoxynucleotidyltransferase terminal-interacting protein 2 [Sitophilus oryzae]
MMDFVIDTIGDREDEIAQLPRSKASPAISEFLQFKQQLINSSDSSTNKSILDPQVTLRDILFSDGTLKNIRSGCRLPKSFQKRTEKFIEQDLISNEVKETLEKSVITPDFENLHTVPPYELAKKKLQRDRRNEKEKTKGEKWYGMPKTEMTDEVKRDLEILQMRSVLDPKHFYKKNDLKVLPKYFQVGKVLDSPIDFYNNRLTQKERKKTLVDELLADAEFQKYNKRKYKEILEEKQKTHYKAWRQAKKLKKKK